MSLLSILFAILRYMKIRLIHRLLFGVILAITLLLIFGYLSYKAHLKQQADDRLVKHSVEVLQTFYRLQGKINTFVNSTADNLTVNDATQNRYFEENKNQAINLSNALSALTADNSTQNELALSIGELTHKLVSEQKRISALQKPGAIAKRQMEFTYLDQLRDDLNYRLSLFDDKECNLLTQRIESAQQNHERALKLQFGRLLLSLIFILSMTFLVVQEFKRRKITKEKLQETVDELKNTNEKNLIRNWQLQGITMVNEALQNQEDATSFAKAALKALLNLFEVPAGIFYLYNPDKDVLVVKSCKGLEIAAGHQIGLGSTLSGTAAAKDEIQYIKDIPQDFFRIKSGLGQKVPVGIIFLPLWHHNELKGLIELPVLNHINEVHMELLHLLSKPIAVAATEVLTKEILSESLNKIEKQHLDLIYSNEAIQRHADALQASEEELRVHEEELRQMNTELATQNEALEETRRSLADQAEKLLTGSKYKSEFLANMSHELRTPLNSILILAKLLSENKSNNLSKKEIDYSELIHKSGTDLLNLINDILDLSKIEAGKVELQHEEVEVKRLFQEVEDMFIPVSENRKINFKVYIEPDSPLKLFTDFQRIAQILKNLLGNAFKFTPANGDVILKASSYATENDLQIMFSITDTGVGIPYEKQLAIFEAFQQADGATNRKYGGTGLGLSISKELAARLGGFITLSSRPKKGSTFNLVLPLNFTPEYKPSTTITDASTSTVPIPQYVKAQHIIQDDRYQLDMLDDSVLIIEDDEHFAKILQGFAKTKGYQTIVATSGDEGLYCAKIYRPSAIILDMNLPVVKGEHILQTLKAEAILSSIPIHIISSQDSDGFYNDKIVGYAIKPLILEQLDQVFMVLKQHIDTGKRKLLFLFKENSAYMEDIKKELSKAVNSNFTVHAAADINESIGFDQFDCIVIQAGGEVSAIIPQLEEIERKKSLNTPIIVYLDQEISSKEEVLLKQHCQSLILHSSASGQRLMDEIGVFLNNHNKKQETSKQPYSTLSANPEPAGSLAEKTALVVDDDMRNLFALSALLDEQGIEVITASNGVEALEQLQINGTRVAIALIDIMMPEMDGYETMRQIRSMPEYASLPLIALTAKAMPEDKALCLQAGASDYITKPIDNNQLIKTLHNWLTNS